MITSHSVTEQMAVYSSVTRHFSIGGDNISVHSLLYAYKFCRMFIYFTNALARGFFLRFYICKALVPSLMSNDSMGVFTFTYFCKRALNCKFAKLTPCEFIRMHTVLFTRICTPARSVCCHIELLDTMTHFLAYTLKCTVWCLCSLTMESGCDCANLLYICMCVPLLLLYVLMCVPLLLLYVRMCVCVQCGGIGVLRCACDMAAICTS